MNRTPMPRWSFSDLGGRSCEVRFTSMSRHREFDRLRAKSANSGRRHTRLSDQKADAVVGECQVTLGIGGNRRSTGED